MSSECPKKKLVSKKMAHREEQELSQNGYSFIRKGSGRIQNFMNGSFKMETLTHGTTAKEIKAAVVTVEPGTSSDDTEIYFGEKWFYVLEGKLELLVNDVFYELNEGDSIYLEPAAIHTWQNSHDKPMKALVFSSPCSLTPDAASDI
jgi:quercetin dioxygenase-like cupin family protein